uniref:Mono(ADP-ribosyl)transferase n=1 Tax=Guillardia theta TaxID=55529 RepID=A0A7S4NVV3_GUITH
MECGQSATVNEEIKSIAGSQDSKALTGEAGKPGARGASERTAVAEGADRKGADKRFHPTVKSDLPEDGSPILHVTEPNVRVDRNPEMRQPPVMAIKREDVAVAESPWPNEKDQLLHIIRSWTNFLVLFSSSDRIEDVHRSFFVEGKHRAIFYRKGGKLDPKAVQHVQFHVDQRRHCVFVLLEGGYPNGSEGGADVRAPWSRLMERIRPGGSTFVQVPLRHQERVRLSFLAAGTEDAEIVSAEELEREGLSARVYRVGEKNQRNHESDDVTNVFVKHVVVAWTDYVVHCCSSNRLRDSVAQQTIESKHQCVVHRKAEGGLGMVDDVQILLHEESSSVLLLFEGGYPRGFEAWASVHAPWGNALEQWIKVPPGGSVIVQIPLRQSPPAMAEDVGMAPGGAEAGKYVAAELKLGAVQESTLGVRHFLGLSQSEYGELLVDGVAGIVREIEEHGEQSDIDNLRYILAGTAGDEKWIPPHVKAQLASRQYHGGAIEEEDYDYLHRGMTLEDFLHHPHSVRAKLSKENVLALRLYTSDTFRLINKYLRAPIKRHPLAMTVMYLTEGICKLRIVNLDNLEPGRRYTLWRGVKDKVVPREFGLRGGTEFACMSTTACKAIADKYAASETPLLFEIQVKPIQMGSSLQFLSVYPKEEEYLYPALTYLDPVCEEPRREGRNVTVWMVNPFVPTS